MDTRVKDIEKFKKYLERRAPERRTSIDYVSDVRQFTTVCLKPWREVTMHDIDDFVDQQRQIGKSAATIKRRVSALKVFFDFLAEENDDLAWPNPVRFKRHAGKPAKRLPRDLTNAQVEQLWAVIDKARDRAWFVLMLRAGMRVGEVETLKLEDLLAGPRPGQPARLRVCGKGQKERVVLLTADAYAVLGEWLQIRPDSEQEHVFLNERGRPLSANGLEWLLRGYSQQAGVKATPHQLRHTFARQLCEGGMTLPSLSKLLGHAQVSTTEIYTAGADPELAQDYQNTMEQLARQAQTSPPKPEQPLPVQPQPDALLPLIVSPAPPPDWDSWATDLPPAIRQASLTFVQRRLLTWKPQRQRVHAQRMLGHLQRFWRWQLTHRPISAPTELQLADLRAFQEAQLTTGKAASTINRIFDDLLALLRTLAEQAQPVDQALFRIHRLPRPLSLPRHLSEAESQSLERYVRNQFDTLDPLLRLENVCFFILAHTGLRASECLDLQFQDLDLAGQRLIVRQGKGNRDRVVFLSQTLRQALDCYLPDLQLQAATPLLVRPTGQPVAYGWLYQHMAALGQAAGEIKVTPHRLRHTLATRLLNAGMKITRIQKILGHDNLNTTMIYARVLDKTVEADYRQAMAKIETRQMPLSQTPELVSDWPMSQTADPQNQSEPAQLNSDHFV